MAKRKQLYHVREVVIYAVKASSEEEAERIITEDEDRDERVVSVTDRDAYLAAAE